MAEFEFTCQRDNTCIKAPTREELAKGIQVHVKDVHKKDLSESAAKELASTARMRS